MTEISSKARSLLARCAQIMAARQNESVDLYPLSGEFHQPGAASAMAAFVVAKVQEFSQGELTVRGAESALFATQTQGFCLEVAVCPNGTKRVTETTADVTLYVIAPTTNGFGTSRMAALEDIAATRAAS